MSLKIILNNKTAILMIWAKLGTLGILTVNIFWNKCYDVIASVHDVTNKILSCNSNYIVDVVMWPKFGNSNISMREVIIGFYKNLTRKTNFFEGCSRFQLKNLGLRIGMALKFYTSLAKWLTLKVIRFRGLIPTFVEVTGEKLVGGPFSLPPSWIGLTINLIKLRLEDAHYIPNVILQILGDECQ